MDRKFYAICGLGLLLFSCHEEEAYVPKDSARCIYLRATVDHTAITRAPYSLTAPNQDNPLKVAVWASTDPLVFKNTGANGNDGSVALHTKANFTNSSEQLLDKAVYPQKDGERAKVYFVGMHPEAGWTTPEGEWEGKTATRTFNGCEDVMLAPRISGQYGENMGTPTNPWPTFLFHHLLTWLKVKVKAESETVSAAWGKLISLKIRSKNTVTVDLAQTTQETTATDLGTTINETVSGFNPDCVSFSGETTETGEATELNVYRTGTDVPLTNEDLPFDEDYKEVAYVLCAPVTATDKDDDGKTTAEYTLVVQTEKRTVEVPVDLKSNTSTPISYFTGNTRGRQFTLNLMFKMGNNIAVIAGVTDWRKEGVSSVWVDPDNPDIIVKK